MFIQVFSNVFKLLCLSTALPFYIRTCYFNVSYTNKQTQTNKQANKKKQLNWACDCKSFTLVHLIIKKYTTTALTQNVISKSFP